MKGIVRVENLPTPTTPQTQIDLIWAGKVSLREVLKKLDDKFMKNLAAKKKTKMKTD
jgi:hypothetical protein